MTPIEKEILRSLKHEPRRWESAVDHAKVNRFWLRDDGLRIDRVTSDAYDLTITGRNARPARYRDGERLSKALDDWESVDNRRRLHELGEALGARG
jgi:hypothetical protein